jgi:hypothetical protein
MQPGISDKKAVDWSLVAMGGTMIVSAAFILSHLV